MSGPRHDALAVMPAGIRALASQCGNERVLALLVRHFSLPRSTWSRTSWVLQAAGAQSILTREVTSAELDRFELALGAVEDWFAKNPPVEGGDPITSTSPSGGDA